MADPIQFRNPARGMPPVTPRDLVAEQAPTEASAWGHTARVAGDWVSAQREKSRQMGLVDPSGWPTKKGWINAATKWAEGMDTSPATIQGVRSKLANLDTLEQAKRIWAEGPYTPAQMHRSWQETGWWREPSDKQWRFEVPDTGSQVLDPQLWGNSRNLKLGDVFHGPMLQGYPLMRNVSLAPEAGSGTGSYMEMPVRAPPFLIQDMRIGVGDPTKVLPSILHEGQHVIQFGEKFAKGGSPSNFLPPGYDKLRAAVEDRVKAYQDKYPAGSGMVPADVMPAYQRTTDALLELQNINRNAWKRYRNIPGENEAANVEKRFLNNLYDVSPMLTRDKPFELQKGGMTETLMKMLGPK